MLRNKGQPNELVDTIFERECCAMDTESKVKKKGDPGKFTIPCSINNHVVKHAFAELGSSII